MKEIEIHKMCLRFWKMSPLCFQLFTLNKSDFDFYDFNWIWNPFWFHKSFNKFKQHVPFWEPICLDFWIKDPSNSTNQKPCIFGWPGSWCLGSSITARFIKPLRLGVIHLWCSQKSDQFFDPLLTPHHLQKWTIDLLFKTKTIRKHVINFKKPPLTFYADVINVCFLTQITLFTQITFAYTS